MSGTTCITSTHTLAPVLWKLSWTELKQLGQRLSLGRLPTRKEETLHKLALLVWERLHNREAALLRSAVYDKENGWPFVFMK